MRGIHHAYSMGRKVVIEMRQGDNEIQAAVIKNGFSYEHQCWIINFVVQRCGHPESMGCKCFGRIHEGQQVRFSQ